MHNLTQSVEVEQIGNLTVPVDPWMFGKQLEAYQEAASSWCRHKVLFNKGRYFEASIWNKELREEVAALIGVEVQYNTMIVASWLKLEDFVVAMNCLGVYVQIEIDWI